MRKSYYFLIYFIIFISTNQLDNFAFCNNYCRYLIYNSNDLLILRGIITDEYGNPLEAQITITDNATNEIVMVSYSHPYTGEFTISLMKNSNYTISIIKEGYHLYSQNYNLTSLINLSEEKNTFILKKNSVDTFVKQSKDIVIKNPTNYYHIIGGSFSTLARAEASRNLLLEQGFIDAVIINSDNKRYRVAYKSFKTKSEAIENLEKLKETTRIKDLWILYY
jgi:hypothetical protein